MSLFPILNFSGISFFIYKTIFLSFRCDLCLRFVFTTYESVYFIIQWLRNYHSLTSEYHQITFQKYLVCHLVLCLTNKGEGDGKDLSSQILNVPLRLISYADVYPFSLCLQSRRISTYSLGLYLFNSQVTVLPVRTPHHRRGFPQFWSHSTPRM